MLPFFSRLLNRAGISDSACLLRNFHKYCVSVQRATSLDEAARLLHLSALGRAPLYALRRQYPESGREPRCHTRGMEVIMEAKIIVMITMLALPGAGDNNVHVRQFTTPQSCIEAANIEASDPFVKHVECAALEDGVLRLKFRQQSPVNGLPKEKQSQGSPQSKAPIG